LTGECDRAHARAMISIMVFLQTLSARRYACQIYWILDACLHRISSINSIFQAVSVSIR